MVKLTPEQVQFYKENGYIKLSNIFTEKEMDEYSAEYTRIFTLKNNPELETSWITNHVKKLANDEEFSVSLIIKRIAISAYTRPTAGHTPPSDERARTHWMGNFPQAI